VSGINTLHFAQKLCHIVRQHVMGHPMTAAVLKGGIKETLCNSSTKNPHIDKYKKIISVWIYDARSVFASFNFWI